MIDPKWLDALKLPQKATIAVALAAGILLALDLRGWLDLKSLGLVVRPVLIIVTVVSATLSAVNIAAFVFAPMQERRHVSVLAARRAVRNQEEEEKRQERQKTILARLDYLSEKEVPYVAECLTKNTPSFYTWAHSSGASQLVAKGLAWSPGGIHHQDHYPFTFHDFVWAAIQERRDEFMAKEGEIKRVQQAARGRR